MSKRILCLRVQKKNRRKNENKKRDESENENVSVNEKVGGSSCGLGVTGLVVNLEGLPQQPCSDGLCRGRIGERERREGE